MYAPCKSFSVWRALRASKTETQEKPKTTAIIYTSVVRNKKRVVKIYIHTNIFARISPNESIIKKHFFSGLPYWFVSIKFGFRVFHLDFPHFHLLARCAQSICLQNICILISSCKKLCHHIARYQTWSFVFLIIDNIICIYINICVHNHIVVLFSELKLIRHHSIYRAVFLSVEGSYIEIETRATKFYCAYICLFSTNQMTKTFSNLW